MKELVCNLHIHTTYSDGTGNYASIAKSALRQGLDVVIITDHNVLVNGVEGYHHENEKTVLLLTGEEVHDQNRRPQKNHTLVIGVGEEMAAFAYDPQLLMDEVQKRDGMAFLAHPHEYDLPMFHEPDISWESWDVEGYTGFELWNGFSEFKTYARTFPRAIFYAFFPEFMAHAPHPETLQKWDEMLTAGKIVFAVAGSDSHALAFKKSFFKKTVLPYDFHFSAINNHLLVAEGLTLDLLPDSRQVYQALRNGHSFIGYDLPTSTRGFTFSIETDDQIGQMGESIKLIKGGTLRVKTPQRAEISVIHNNQVFATSQSTDTLSLTVTESGYYRVQCMLDFLGKKRGWIYSNPIFCSG
jgi:hypothetical protein